MGKIYLVRHGQSEWNVAGRIQGHLDIKLSDLGREQAKKAGMGLINMGISHIYASDLLRALETAEIISRIINAPISGAKANLREIDFGDWSGMTFEEIHAAAPEELEQWRADRVNRVVPGGESFQQMTERVLASLHGLAEKHMEEKIAVVSHGGPIIYTLGTILGYDVEELLKLRINNCSISLLEYDGLQRTWAVYGINETSHLNGEV